MSKIQVNDIELDYEDYGNGNVLLMLHGLGSTKKDWDAQVPFFSKKYRVLTLDLRGHGASKTTSKTYGVKVMTDDVKAFMDVLEIPSATMVGFSMGGAIAFELAVRYPIYIDKLVIVNSGPDFNNMGIIGDDLLKGRIQFLETKGLKVLAKEIAYNMFPEDHQINMRDAFEQRCKSNDYDAYYQSFVTLMQWGIGDALQDIKVKTLVVASDMDYTPVAFKQAYVDRMPNAKLCIIENSRHGVVIDQPDAFNTALNNFLNED